MHDAGLVVVYGASDDLMEFDGAIRDEVGAYNGSTAYLDTNDLLKNECEEENCPYFEKLKEKALKIEALSDIDGFTFKYRTTIPHATFVVYDDRETSQKYCEGIVFALADLKN